MVRTPEITNPTPLMPVKIARNATTPTGKPGLVQPKRDQNEENSQRTDWDRIAALVRQSRNVAIRGLRLNTESASASASRPPSSGRTRSEEHTSELQSR